jgi:hypothetical protein
MNAGDQERFALTVAALAANFRAEVTDQQLRILWLALRNELTLPEFERAAAKALREREFMPNVAELLALAGKKKRETVRMIDGKPHVWMEGRGWGEFHGPASFLEDGPTPAREILGPVLAMLEPPANNTGGKR